jgi:hypothetical protein
MFINFGLNDSNKNDKNAIDDRRADVIKTILEDAYAELVRSRNSIRLVYKTSAD